MKRLALVLGVPLVLIAVVATSAVLTSSDTQPSAASVARSAPKRCNFVLVGKHASDDGSVLMGYNNDWAASNYMYMQVMPGDATHFQFVRLLTEGGVQEGGINVHKLGVLYGTATTLDASVAAADPYLKKGYGGETWDLILQQCTTASQAIDLLGQMAATKGFSGDVAGSFAIGDPHEAWLFELFGGRHWVAQRVPDRAVLEHPNTVTVRQIDLSDRANFRGSADLQAFAQSIGRYDPTTGPFDVAWAFADRDDLQSYYNTNRMWAAYNLVAPSLHLDPTMPYATRPVHVRPDHNVSRQDLMAIFRNHFEGTALDQTQGYTLMSPHDETDRPICYATTDYSAIWQLRSWLPDNIGGVMWVAPSRPCSSAYTPFYDSITTVPAEWTSQTGYDAFKAVAKSLDKKGKVHKEIRYEYYIPLVHSTYGAYEADCTCAQSGIEATASSMTPANQVAYLTNYSNQRATQAYNLAVGLPAQMP